MSVHTYRVNWYKLVFILFNKDFIFQKNFELFYFLIASEKLLNLSHTSLAKTKTVSKIFKIVEMVFKSFIYVIKLDLPL